MSGSPRVSVGIPTYNMGQFLGRAVESALRQTWTDLEIVVCDNASTDDTTEVLSRFQDPRLRVIRHPSNIGMIANFNAVISNTRAPWIKFLEADDLLEPGCLEKMLRVAESQPGVALVSGGCWLIGPDDRVIGQRLKEKEERVLAGASLRNMVKKRGNVVGTPTDVLVRRDLLDRVGHFDMDYGVYLNDWDLWLRCGAVADIFLMAEPVVRVRQHPGQVGASGARTNVDIHVNFLFLEKVWGQPTVFSALWRQKMVLRFLFAEGYVWRGVRRVFSRPETGSRWDVFDRLLENLGPLECVGALVYTCLHAPLYIVDKWRKRRRRGVAA